MGFWYALEDSAAENRCLSFLLGSHKSAKIAKGFVRKKGGEERSLRIIRTRDSHQGKKVEVWRWKGSMFKGKLSRERCADS